jgi:hypothetical protein
VTGRAAAAVALLLAACAPAGTSGPRPGLTLDAEGIQPAGTDLRIDFGRAQQGTIEAVTRLVGARPAEITANAECGAGPVTAARWDRGPTLTFQDGTFLGWVSDGSGPAATSGIGPGSPGAALAGATFSDTSLGTEFETDGIFGLVEGDRVVTLWSGLTCFFR